MATFGKQNKADDIHLEIQKDVKQPERNVIKSIPTGTLLYIGIGAIVTLYFALQKGYNMNKTFFLITAVAALAILLSLNMKGTRLLTEQECKVELYQHLKFKQRHKLGEHKELPEGTIKIYLKGRLRFFNGAPWKRQIGFSILTNEGFEHQYSAELNPYTGDIISIFDGYFDPKDPGDLVYVASPELAAERRYSDYGGGRGGGGR